MSTLAESPSIPTAKELTPVPRDSRRKWTYFVLPIYSSFFFIYLLIPISVMILYSFNVSRSALPQVTFKWQGFTTQWYHGVERDPRTDAGILPLHQAGADRRR